MNEQQQAVDIQVRKLIADLTNTPAESVHVTFAPTGLFAFKAAFDAGKLPAVKTFAVDHDMNFDTTDFVVSPVSA